MKNLGMLVFFVLVCLLILRLPNDTGLPTGILLAETPTPREATLVPVLGLVGQGVETAGHVARETSEYGICAGPFLLVLILIIGVFAVNCLRVKG